MAFSSYLASALALWAAFYFVSVVEWRITVRSGTRALPAHEAVAAARAKAWLTSLAYWPTWWCFGNWLMIVEQHLVPCRRRVCCRGCDAAPSARALNATREPIILADGGTMSIDWVGLDGDGAAMGAQADRGAAPSTQSDLPLSPPRVVVLLFPGIGMSLRTRCVRTTIAAIRRRGGGRTAVATLNARGVSGNKLTSPTPIDMARCDDFAHAVRHVRARFPAATLVGWGLSLGANIMVHMLGTLGAATSLACAVSLSNPYDVGSMLAIRDRFPFSNAALRSRYEGGFVSWFKRRLRKSKALFDNAKSGSGSGFEWEELDACKTIDTIGDFIATKVYDPPYASFEEYIDRAASAPLLKGVQIPLLLLSARDDPLVPPTLFPTLTECGANVVLLTTKRGGHVAWMSGTRGSSWADDVALGFLERGMALAGVGWHA